MTPTEEDPVYRPGWAGLRRFTDARIALGRAGAGLPTEAHLAFQLAHARARDAVHSGLDTTALLTGLRERGQNALLLHSAAADRREYLQRPDLGRMLNEASRARLPPSPIASEIALVLVDGLSAQAVDRHALPLLDDLFPALQAAGIRIAESVAVVEQGRVAIGDEIAHRLGADLVAVLIGERPGLSAPDSLGVYLTWRPVPGVTTDAERNCISNIRGGGLPYDVAVARLLYLVTEARHRQLTGVELKEEAEIAEVRVKTLGDSRRTLDDD